jgi:hypothetical protein
VAFGQPFVHGGVFVTNCGLADDVVRPPAMSEPPPPPSFRTFFTTGTCDLLFCALVASAREATRPISASRLPDPEHARNPREGRSV